MYLHGVIVLLWALVVRGQQDSTYLDPNKFIHSQQENERIQTRLRDFLQQNPDSAQDPNLSRDLLTRFQQNQGVDSTRYRSDEAQFGRRQQSSQRFETSDNPTPRYDVREPYLRTRGQQDQRVSDADRYNVDDNQRPFNRDQRPFTRDELADRQRNFGRDPLVRGGQQSRFLNSGFDGQRLGAPRGKTYLPDTDLRRFLHQIDLAASQQCTNNVIAQWDFETNVNEATQVRALESQLAHADFQRKVHELVSQIDEDGVQDQKLRRQLKYLAVVGHAALPRDQLNRYNSLINEMLAIYNSATICAHQSPLRCNLRLDPELSVIMARSRDWNELQHTWTEFRRKTGMKIKDLFENLVDLSNYAAQLNNMTDASEYWMFPYESPSFRFELEDVWEQIKPLYEQLHAYVRRKLRDLYGPEKISREAPLPAHILGNMWAQSWSNILDITIPYPGKNVLDVTPQMLQQGYTPEAMFRIAEDFFVSLNMSAMPPEFWANSIFAELPDRPIICQPSAWDFCNRRDYRIKMCAQVNMKDFITVHHEMAHIQYFLKYRNQPKIFRDGANPGFHEAISEAIALSVSNPKHMQTLGLVQTSIDDLPHNINYLFSMAMDKLPFMPFSLSLDLWRYDIFRNNVGKQRYNCHWWDLRERLSGVKPPVLRSEVDFDAGSKYHVPANIPYIGYFVGTVLQFQIHRALCRAANQYNPDDPSKPLHKCDIYRSKEAGYLLSNLMELGSSQHWTQTLYEATGETRLSGDALREYFRPLEDWLRSENVRTNEFIGWIYDGDYCKHSIETANLQVYGGYYNAASRSFGTTLVFGIASLALGAIYFA
nr:PREDICTED: angiotensin-converting enzyme-like isoform X1 [Bemisia tabaci]XP_018914958.1 PREDICTED: angiotensin-converting enzyme-like isoform X1 [Bemisia tabaci]